MLIMMEDNGDTFLTGMVVDRATLHHSKKRVI
jgi:hypothetical protein